MKMKHSFSFKINLNLKFKQFHFSLSFRNYRYVITKHRVHETIPSKMSEKKKRKKESQQISACGILDPFDVVANRSCGFRLPNFREGV